MSLRTTLRRWLSRTDLRITRLDPGCGSASYDNVVRLKDRMVQREYEKRVKERISRRAK